MKKPLSLILIIGIIITFSSCLYIAQPKTGQNSEEKQVSTESFNIMDPYELACELGMNGINIEESDTYDICFLIQAKEDLSNNSDSFDVSSIPNSDHIDEALTEHRLKVKKYYSAFNEEIVEVLCLEEYNYCVSFYSPYIEIIFDDIAEFIIDEGELIEVIQNSNGLISSASNYAILSVSDEEALVNDSLYAQTYSMSQAFEYIGVINSNYTGQGIRVGVVEPGVPDSTNNLKAGLYDFLGAPSTDHCTVVTSIIGGQHGIAENVHFYCLPMSNYINDDLNLLISGYNVNLINISAYYYICGYYSDIDACVDTIVATTGCTIVKSAGNQSNESENTYYISTPGCAMNVITVGSIDFNRNISIFSSWLTTNDFLLKPDVVAPGEKISGIPNITGVWSGTSFSAPMVTGTIALLMEEFPILKARPDLVKSLVHLGAEMLPTQDTYFDEKAGFGLINYQNMRECMLYQRYWTFDIPVGAAEGMQVSTYNVTIPYLKAININANHFINPGVLNPDTDVHISNYFDCTIKIYDKSTQQCVAVSTVDSTVDYLNFTNFSQTNSQFEIKVFLESYNYTAEIARMAIAFEIYDHFEHEYVSGYGKYTDDYHKIYCACGNYLLEDHSYTHHYEKYNSSSHDAYCICGEYINTGHVLMRPVGGTGLDLSICKYCGATVSFGVLDSIPSDYPHTENGSYILPNGIIVLVPEDEEAYLNGTLEFRTGEVM